MALKNLGTVQALFIGTSPPSNVNMLWYNTGINSYTRYKHHYYDIGTSTWKAVNADVSLSSALTNGGVTYINVGTKSLHSLIQIKYKILRSTSVATGILEVYNDGSSVQITEIAGRTIYGSDIEVGYDAIGITVGYSSDNIRLIVTCSNTGHTATANLFEIKQIA